MGTIIGIELNICTKYLHLFSMASEQWKINKGELILQMFLTLVMFEQWDTPSNECQA